MQHDPLNPDSESAPEFTRAELDFRIAQLDDRINSQLNEILHHPDFRRLEAAWRGLHYLLGAVDDHERSVIRIIHVTKNDLRKDFNRSGSTEKSELYRKLYLEVIEKPDEPFYGMLVGEFEITNHPPDIALVEDLAAVAASIHALFVSGFKLADSIPPCEDPEMPGDVHVFGVMADRPEFRLWRNFRDSNNANYVWLTVWEILLRPNYDDFDVGGVSFQESKSFESRLLGNAAFAFAACVIRAYSTRSWLGRIAGPETDGRVERLPGFYYGDGRKGSLSVGFFPVYGGLSEETLSALGFVPILQKDFGEPVAFSNARSCYRPRRYQDDDANTRAVKMTELPYHFAVSRIAHTILAMIRDRYEPFENVAECQRFLLAWLCRYSATEDRSDTSVSESRPFREAFISIIPSEEEPDKAKAFVYLKPAYLLEELIFAMRIIVDLPKPIRAPSLFVRSPD